jgi:hypothetical protein
VRLLVEEIATEREGVDEEVEGQEERCTPPRDASLPQFPPRKARSQPQSVSAARGVGRTGRECLALGIRRRSEPPWGSPVDPQLTLRTGEVLRVSRILREAGGFIFHSSLTTTPCTTSFTDIPKHGIEWTATRRTAETPADHPNRGEEEVVRPIGPLTE